MFGDFPSNCTEHFLIFRPCSDSRLLLLLHQLDNIFILQHMVFAHLLRVVFHRCSPHKRTKRGKWLFMSDRFKAVNRMHVSFFSTIQKKKMTELIIIYIIIVIFTPENNEWRCIYYFFATTMVMHYKVTYRMQSQRLSNHVCHCLTHLFPGG